jgi:hypothetical protein
VGSEDAILGCEVFILKQEFLIDRPGEVRPTAEPICCLAWGTSIINSFRSREYFDHTGFRSGQKDDLVMAFALAAWKARQFLPTSSP